MIDIPTTPEGDKLYAEGIKLLYKKQYGNITKMLQNPIPSKVAPTLSKIVNKTLSKLNKRSEMTIELAAEVGMRLLTALIEDMVQDGVIKELTPQQAMGAVADTINDYAIQNNLPDEAVQQFLQQLKQKQQEMAAQEQGMPEQGVPEQGAMQ
jgi:Mg/Co/Ni transporter MgtE